MDGFLPPVDVGGWLEFQRKRAQQLARERIAAANQTIGAGAQATGDWIGRAGQQIDGLLPDWAAQPAELPQTPQLPTPSPYAVRDWGAGALDRIGQLGQDAGSAIDRAQGIISSPLTGARDIQRFGASVQPEAEAAFPDDPLSTPKYVAQQAGRGLNQAQAASQAQFDAMMGFGPQGSNLGTQALGAVGVGFTPYTAAGEVAGNTASNLGADANTAAAVRGVTQTLGPGGITGNIAKREALPLIGAGVGALAGAGSGVAQGRPSDEIISRAAEGAGMGQGVGELLPVAGRGLRGLADRYGTRPPEGPAAVAGLGRPDVSDRFGIQQAVANDIEGQVAGGARSAPLEMVDMTGAPGSRPQGGLRGVPRVRSVNPVPEEIRAGSRATVDESGVRTAPTLYEYLSAMADDYAAYRNFYPDFGRFYQSLTEPAGEGSEGLFNELGALWAATAAQTAPHDNLTKAIKASMAARTFLQRMGRPPNQAEIYLLLTKGELRDGALTNGKGGNQAKIIDPGTLVGHVDEVQLFGTSKKMTLEDAKKIAQVYETGDVVIPSNFKLTAFNLLNALAARGEYSPYSVIDTHMFRLFGYATDASGRPIGKIGKIKVDPADAGGSPNASRFVQAMIQQLAEEKGWNPDQVQSALWYGAKNEVAPRSAVKARGRVNTVTLYEDTFGLPKGTEVDDGTLAYSVEKNRQLLNLFAQKYAPQGPVNEASARARVIFPGARSERGMPTFSLDDAAQERASTWMENRGYTFNFEAGPEELRALGYDPQTGKLQTLIDRGIPGRVVPTADGRYAIQLYTRSDVAARSAAGVIGRGTSGNAALEPIRPVFGTTGTEAGAVGPGTGQVFQVDKFDGTPWTADEVSAARGAGVPLHVSPDGVSLVVRAEDAGAGFDQGALRDALEAAGTPPLAVQPVTVRSAGLVDTADEAAGEADALGVVAGEDGVQGALQRALASVQPYGAASTGGERAFDLAAGTAGGVAGAATADEDATWQERAKRFAIGSAGAALAGPTARGALGQLARTGAADDVLGITSKQRRVKNAGPAPLTKLGTVVDLSQGFPLISIKSLATNALGGALRTTQRFGQDTLGDPLRPDRALRDIYGMAAAFPDALKAFMGEMKGVSAKGAAGLGLSRGGLADRPGWGPWVATAGTRANAGTDRFWATLNEGGARARGLAEGQTAGEADAAATRAGDFASYTGPNSPIATFLTDQGRVARDPTASNRARLFGATMAGMAPYVKTPERIFLATGKLATDFALQAPALARAIKRGDHAARREAQGRMALSAIVMTLAAREYLDGKLRGEPPANPTERRRQEAQGAQWNTWRGIPLRQLGNYGQAAAAVATGMAAGERAQLRGEDPSDAVRDTANAVAKWALSESYLDDLVDFGTDISEGRASQAIEKQAASVVGRTTTAFASPLAAADLSERTREGFGQELLYNIPGGRFALPERIDPATGQPMRKKGTGIQRYFMGTQGREESPEGQELNRYGVSAPTFKAGSEFAGERQTGDQARAIQRASGSEVNREVRETIQSAEYRRADDEEKAKLLRAAVARGRAAADVVVGQNVARSPEAKAKAEWQAVPKYRGMDGTPEEIRRLNARIARAKANLAAAKRKGDDVYDRWINEHPDEYDLTLYKEADTKLLKIDREEIEAKYPGVDLGG